jgi:ATP/maltotriose-dependent transcriptional regulator MalT
MAVEWQRKPASGGAAVAAPATPVGKMRPPRQRIFTARRDALLAELDESAGALLTIAQSPAGFGKTTLLAQWYERLQAREDVTVGWLSLDEDDGEITRFLANFALALRAAGAPVDPAAMRQAPSLSEAADRREALSKAIDRAAGTVVMILDDYHRVRSTEVDETLDALIRRHPSGFHLVISTRDRPALRVADLEAQGLVGFVDANMLALTIAEAA